MLRGFGLFLGKALAAVAFSVAFISNFTSCVVFINQPQMPEKVRMLKK
jgi:cyclic lactone autoinducer peptide